MDSTQRAPAAEDTGGGGEKHFFWAVIVLGVAIPALGVLLIDRLDQWRDVLLAVFAGVAASALWWAIFARYAEREGKRLLTEELDAQHRRLDSELDFHRSALATQLANESRRWRESSFPRDIYKGTENFSLRFNRDLSKNLNSSSIFYFSGRTGIYVPARIWLRSEATDERLEYVRLRINDPENERAMSQAIADRLSRAENAGKTRDEIQAKIHDDFRMTLVGLWHCREHVSNWIKVWYESTAVIKRVELFDEAVYDSSIEANGRAAFPLSAAWTHRQATYTLIEEDFLRDDHAVPAFTITPLTTRTELEQHLAGLGVDPGNAEDCWGRYNQAYMKRMRHGLERSSSFEDVVDLAESPKPQQEITR